MVKLPVQADECGLRLFTVAEYENLIVDGFFSEDERFELLEGYIVRRPSPSPPHACTSGLCGDVFRRVLPKGWQLQYLSPITLTASVPEPDIAVIRDRGRDYFRRHPGRDDLGFVVEIADNALLLSRRDKARIYSNDGIPEYWIVNLIARQVEVYTDPQPNGYATRQDFPHGTSIPLTLDGTVVGTLAVADILP